MADKYTAERLMTEFILRIIIILPLEFSGAVESTWKPVPGD